MLGKTPFPSVEMIIDLHDRALAMTGGAPGVRSIDAVAGAWGRTEARLFYEPDLTAPEVAATLAVSVAKAHGFTDGNKRAAYGSLAMTLAMNGVQLTASADETVSQIVAAAAGDGDPETLGQWVRANSAADPVYQGLFEYDLGGPEVA